MTVRALELPHSPADEAPTIALVPRDWQDTRWLGQQSGYTTSRDLLAGGWVSPEARSTVSRLYASACADLAQATVGGLPPHSADWERWFTALRTTARQLSPSQAGSRLVQPMSHWQPRVPSVYAVLRHFPNFRAAWDAAGVPLRDSRWAAWTAEQDWHIVTQLGVEPTIAIAAALGRGEAAVRARARTLGLRVGTARG